MRPARPFIATPATQRRVRRLLQALAHAVDDARRNRDGAFVIPVSAGGVRRVVHFDAEVVMAAHGEGLVAIGSDDVLVLTDRGHARRRRESADAMPFLAQHRALAGMPIVVDGLAQNVLIDLAESPLAWLHRRRGSDGEALVSPAGFAAGERLRAEFTRAQMTPALTTRWDVTAIGRHGGGAPAAPTDNALAARQRVARALDVVGPELAGILLDVCCFLKGLETVEKERRWPPRSAKVVLRLALDRLAAHYGLSDAARGPDCAVGLRVHRASDARGSIAGRPAATP